MFHDRKTTHHPHHKPSFLIIDGPFRLTRNPIYLGFLLMSFGYSLYIGKLSSLISPIIFFFVIDRMVIQYEERMLSDTFGKEYDEYRKSVRRWV